MAVDMFLKITEAPGESKGANHVGEIDILAWSWGLSQNGSTHSGTGGGAGKVNVQDFSFTKYVDKSSPKLALLCCNGQHLKEAILTVQKAGKDPVPYVKITYNEFIVSSISMGGSGGEDRLTENVAFNFAKVKYEYTPQKDDGTKDTAIPFTWDIPKNAAT
jgi:type VI secretion system secreted protein Hcp